MKEEVTSDSEALLHDNGWMKRLEGGRRALTGYDVVAGVALDHLGGVEMGWDGIWSPRLVNWQLLDL